MNKTLQILFASFIISFCGIAQVQIGLEINGETNGDNSGTSVSISGDGLTVAVGSPYNDGNGSNSGQVKIYRNISGNNWVQIGSDILGEASDDESGFSVSINGDGTTVAIGAPKNDGNGTNAGHVRVYKFLSGNWVKLGNDIDGEAAGDQSGYSVSLNIDGSSLAIGAPNNDGNGIDAGHVRIYNFLSGNWVQQGGDINGEVAGDQSGYSVSLSTDDVFGSTVSTVAIGAPLNDGNGTNAGHVRVYAFAFGVWFQQGVDIDGESNGDAFGSSVALSDDGLTLAIGAPLNDGNGTNAGHVRIFALNTGNNVWYQKGIDIDGLVAGNQTGYSVSLSDDGQIVAIGSPFDDMNGANSGNVRIYRFISGTWTQQGSNINGDFANDESGTSVGLDNDGLNVVIGAPLNNGNGSSSGQTRVFNTCKSSSTDTHSACGSFTWIDGITYTFSNNIASHNLTNVLGCDSIVTLNLTINNPSSAIDTKFACGSYTWIDGNTYLTSNNTATYTFTNAVGCDSIVTLNLTVSSQPNLNTSFSGATITSLQPGATYQWLDCDNDSVIIPNATNQSYTATVNGSYAVVVNLNGCSSDTSSCVSITNVDILESGIKSNIRIYPNPVKNQLNIEKLGGVEPLTIRVFNLQGKLIKEIEKSSTNILVIDFDFQSGIYLIEVSSDKTITTEIILKN